MEWRLVPSDTPESPGDRFVTRLIQQYSKERDTINNTAIQLMQDMEKHIAEAIERMNKEKEMTMSYIKKVSDLDEQMKVRMTEVLANKDDIVKAINENEELQRMALEAHKLSSPANIYLGPVVRDLAPIDRNLISMDSILAPMERESNSNSVDTNLNKDPANGDSNLDNAFLVPGAHSTNENLNGDSITDKNLENTDPIPAYRDFTLPRLVSRPESRADVPENGNITNDTVTKESTPTNRDLTPANREITPVNTTLNRNSIPDNPSPKDRTPVSNKIKIVTSNIGSTSPKRDSNSKVLNFKPAPAFKGAGRDKYGYTPNFIFWLYYIDNHEEELLTKYGSINDALRELTIREAREYLEQEFLANIPLDWVSFRAKFIDRYLPPNYGQILRRKVLRHRQGAYSINEYNGHFNDTVDEYHMYLSVMGPHNIRSPMEISPKMQIEIYMNGLDNRLRYFMPEEFEEYSLNELQSMAENRAGFLLSKRGDKRGRNVETPRRKDKRPKPISFRPKELERPSNNDNGRDFISRNSNEKDLMEEDFGERDIFDSIQVGRDTIGEDFSGKDLFERLQVDRDSGKHKSDSRNDSRTKVVERKNRKRPKNAGLTPE